MFVESLEDLPEGLRSQFVETEIDGKKGYQDKDAHELRNHLFNVKSENKDLKTRYGEASETLKGYEEAKQREIEEARKKAIEEARKSGNTELFEQQLADAKKRFGETESQYQERIKGLEDRIKGEKRNAIVADLASEYASKDGAAAFKRLVASMIDVDVESGKEIYLDDNGGATSLDKSGFIAELKKNAVFAPVLKADVVTSGGGKVNGGGSGGATVKTASRAEFEGWNQAQRSEFFKKGGKLTD